MIPKMSKVGLVAALLAAFVVVRNPTCIHASETPRLVTGLLASKHVVSLEVISVNPTKWGDDAKSGLQKRSLTVTLEVRDVVTGDIKASKDPVSTTIDQYRLKSLSIRDPRTFWSHRKIIKGQNYMLFSDADSPSLQTEFSNPKAVLLLRDKENLVGEAKYILSVAPRPLQDQVKSLEAYLKKKLETEHGRFLARYMYHLLLALHESEQPTKSKVRAAQIKWLSGRITSWDASFSANAQGNLLRLLADNADGPLAETYVSAVKNFLRTREKIDASNAVIEGIAQRDLPRIVNNKKLRTLFCVMTEPERAKILGALKVLHEKPYGEDFKTALARLIRACSGRE